MTVVKKMTTGMGHSPLNLFHLGKALNAEGVTAFNSDSRRKRTFGKWQSGARSQRRGVPEIWALFVFNPRESQGFQVV